MSDVFPFLDVSADCSAPVFIIDWVVGADNICLSGSGRVVSDPHAENFIYHLHVKTNMHHPKILNFWTDSVMLVLMSCLLREVSKHLLFAERRGN